MSQQHQPESIQSTAKTGEPDRYLAALLAKPPERDSLIALAAFGSEIARIPARVNDPLLRAIRLQWWRDTLLTAADAGIQSGHPVADAVASTIRLHHLPLHLFEELIDAWDGDPGATVSISEVPTGNPELITSSVLFQLSAIICGAQPSTTLSTLTDDAGLAYAISTLLLRGVQHGNCTDLETTCLTHLNAARQLVQELPRIQRLAFLPLALVQPYLRLAQSNTKTRDKYHADISPLSRIWRIWWSYCRSQP